MKKSSITSGPGLTYEYLRQGCVVNINHRMPWVGLKFVIVVLLTF